MLYSCEFGNFTSFKDPVEFELDAPKNRVRKRYPDNYVEMESGELVLKDAVIVGENAGGKSNFVTAFKFLRSLFVRNDVSPRSYLNLIFSGNLQYDDKGDVELGESVTLQPFEIEIAFGEMTVRYTLCLDIHGVTSEMLERRDSSGEQYRLVFKNWRNDSYTECKDCPEGRACRRRDDDSGCWTFNVSYGEELSIPKELADRLLVSPMEGELMVKSLATLGERSCKALTSWFSSELAIASRHEGRFSIEGVSSDQTERILGDSRYFDIIRLVDSSIVGMRVDKERPFLDSVLIRRSKSGRTFERPIREDSTGVAQFAQWAMAIYLVVYDNKTVLADEVDSAINPVLSDKVVAYINGCDHTGQFVFTTHNAFNLTFRSFMKEQIFFVTKDVESLESSMYSLADFKDVRYDVKGEIYELYLRGLLGGTQDA